MAASRQRRAQTQPGPAWADVDVWAWQKLVEQPGMRGISLQDYYGSAPGASAGDAEMLARSVYLDLGSIEAIQCPRGMDLEDFELAIGLRPLISPFYAAGTEPEASYLLVRHRLNAEERLVCGKPGTWLKPVSLVSGAEVGWVVSAILAAFAGGKHPEWGGPAYGQDVGPRALNL